MSSLRVPVASLPFELSPYGVLTASFVRARSHGVCLEQIITNAVAWRSGKFARVCITFVTRLKMFLRRPMHPSTPRPHNFWRSQFERHVRTCTCDRSLRASLLARKPCKIQKPIAPKPIFIHAKRIRRYLTQSYDKSLNTIRK